MSDTTLFISRDETDCAVLLKAFDTEGFNWSCVPLLTFTPIAFEIPWTDWLYFYSKNGVKYFFQDQPHTKLRPHKYACFGPGTASYLFEMTGHLPDLVGSGEKTVNTNQLIDTIGTESICFVRGKTSQRSVQKLLKETKDYEEVIVYDNQTRSGLQLSNYDIAVLTSPLNYDAFTANGGTANMMVTLGDTTFTHIKATNPSQECVRSNSATMDSVATSIESLLKSHS